MNISESSPRELAQMVRGTIEASHEDRLAAKEELIERGYDDGTVLDLAGPWNLEDVHEDFAEGDS